MRESHTVCPTSRDYKWSSNRDDRGQRLPQEFICIVCNINFKSNNALVTHVQTIHTTHRPNYKPH